MEVGCTQSHPSTVEGERICGGLLNKTPLTKHTHVSTHKLTRLCATRTDRELGKSSTDLRLDKSLESKSETLTLNSFLISLTKNQSSSHTFKKEQTHMSTHKLTRICETQTDRELGKSSTDLRLDKSVEGKSETLTLQSHPTVLLSQDQGRKTDKVRRDRRGKDHGLQSTPSVTQTQHT